MPIQPYRPHRLHVSTMAALANPAYRRLDVWQALDETCRRLAALHDAGRDTTTDAAHVARLLDQLDAYERYWLYPGEAGLRRLRELMAEAHFGRLADEVTRTAQLLSTYGDRAALLNAGAGSPDREPAGTQARRQYHTVLLADHTEETAREPLRQALEAMRLPSDDTVYGVLTVDSIEEAITAVALNGDIQAAVIRHDLPLRSQRRTPLASALLQVDDWTARTTKHYDWEEAGEALREMRPHIDLYSLHGESIAAGGTGTPRAYNRTFYRLNDPTDLHSTIIAGLRRRYRAPFFDALRAYADSSTGQFHALPVARGASVFNSRTLADMADFYGRNIFMAETSSAAGGLDSLLDPHGSIRDAMTKAAFTWSAQHTYFATNGTSTANKIVVQALTRPGDIVLIDRNCHKSHHYGLVLAGAQPVYLDAYPLPEYAMYGAVPLATIKQALLDLEAIGELDRVRMLLLTNCTFDGVVANPLQVMQEVLAIKPDICFLWDEAWYAFATAVPYARQRTAMPAARSLQERLAGAEYREEYERWRASMDGIDPAELSAHPLMADPDLARVRVYATQSTHKSLSALRQGSMIHIWDQDFDRLAREPFYEAYLAHTSTSPNQELTASLDLARRQVDLEGFELVRTAYRMALAFRHRVARDPVISQWFRILDEADLVPEKFRASAGTSYERIEEADLAKWDDAWQHAEFVLDPTRVTLYVGDTGMNGFEFRQDVLMDRWGIQINKTSINTVLLNFTIGVTWSSVQYLLDVLQRVAFEISASHANASRVARQSYQRRVDAVTRDLPSLPNFSAFAPAFRSRPESPAGDMRSAYYASYEEADREHVDLATASEMLAKGDSLVSTTFVVPYPPGFPILVPGQLISGEILEFIAQLDVKEIHGYEPRAGFSVFTQSALSRWDNHEAADTEAAPR
ncbi:aminotransferase class I/II-fold pyridoxal phosphate-dependent enzyme [Actinoplanes sp. URMC 104]|uniref:aminotransferase class I/II-fold pyridoxal phosphate-dependent enzyme n=1 Tax=Actinoplanes sp. URMC 104 TaxID=3423409 RepID=UPI003F1B04F1